MFLRLFQNGEAKKEVGFAAENLQSLQAALQLEKEMGESVGRSAVLQRRMQKKQIHDNKINRGASPRCLPGTVQTGSTCCAGPGVAGVPLRCAEDYLHSATRLRRPLHPLAQAFHHLNIAA
jgi:hypothetical protein